MNKKFIIVLLFVLFIVGCTKKNNSSQQDVPSEPQVSTITDVDKFKKEYENGNKGVEVIVPDNALINYSNSQEILNILEKGSGIIYFGRPTCPWCRNAISVLINNSIDNYITINYYNPGEQTSDDMEAYVKVKKILNPYIGYNSEGQKVLGIPDVYFVLNGKIIGHHLGTVDSQSDPYIEMNDIQKQELYNIYQEYIEQIK